MKAEFKTEVIDFIRSIDEQCKIELNYSLIDGLNADLYLTEVNTAIIFLNMEAAVSIAEKRIQLINEQKKSVIKIVHLWEDQWIYHNDKIKSKIKSLLGVTERIHGRQTKLINLNNTQLMNFLKSHHLNVPIKGKYKYGLTFDEELVAVMSFSKARDMTRCGQIYKSFELLRFCNKLNYTVVGGFTKLLNHFIKELNPEDIMTYIDADWSNGQSLKSIGFKLEGFMKPMVFWLNIKTGEREYPNLVLQNLGQPKELFLQQDKLDDFLLKHGYSKVYNSGSYKYIMRLK